MLHITAYTNTSKRLSLGHATQKHIDNAAAAAFEAFLYRPNLYFCVTTR
jgi:hypothetical protein